MIWWVWLFFFFSCLWHNKMKAAHYDLSGTLPFPRSITHAVSGDWSRSLETLETAQRRADYQRRASQRGGADQSAAAPRVPGGALVFLYRWTRLKVSCRNAPWFLRLDDVQWCWGCPQRQLSVDIYYSAVCLSPWITMNCGTFQWTASWEADWWDRLKGPIWGKTHFTTFNYVMCSQRTITHFYLSCKKKHAVLRNSPLWCNSWCWCPSQLSDDTSCIII